MSAQPITDMKNRILNYLRAGYPCLYLVSHEEGRIERLMVEVAKAHTTDDNEAALYSWSVTQGRHCVGTNQADELDEITVLSAVADMPTGSILLLRDYHFYFADANPVLIRTFKDALAQAKGRGIGIIIISGILKLPDELAKSITVLDFELPDHAALKTVLELICASNTDTAMPEAEELEAILDAASGLTTPEAEDAIALSLVEEGRIVPAVLQREKANTVRKNGILEIVDRNVTLDDIGGLDVLKADLLSKRKNFTKAARQRGIPSPRAVLAVGMAGTGKSLIAQAMKTIFGIILLRLDAGQLFDGLVGGSERKWREAFATARAMRPCILWIDECDGLFSGGKASGQTDGGTTARVIKSILQDMQFNSDGILFAFTANDIDGIHDAVIDRSDVWFVDLPNVEERTAIWTIHIAKLREEQTVPYNPPDFKPAALAEATEGFSGRQIEQVWIAATTRAFADDDRDVTYADVINVAQETIPTSQTMATNIAERRQRLEGRARNATGNPNAKQQLGTTIRKITVKK